MQHLDTKWMNTFGNHWEELHQWRTWVAANLFMLLVLDNGWKKACLAYLLYVGSFATSKKPLEPDLKDVVDGTHTEMSTLGICDLFLFPH